MEKIINFLMQKKEYYENLYITELDTNKSIIYYEIINIIDDLLDNIYKIYSN